MAAKILIVEDHEDALELLKLQIQSLRYDVIEASDGLQALERSLAETPDLIIMDIGLPRMDGIEATAKLKENPKTAKIPVIAYSAWDGRDTKERAQRAGMAAFLTKPCLPKAFQGVIQRFL